MLIDVFIWLYELIPRDGDGIQVNVLSDTYIVAITFSLMVKLCSSVHNPLCVQPLLLRFLGDRKLLTKETLSLHLPMTIPSRYRYYVLLANNCEPIAKVEVYFEWRILE